MTAQPFPPAIPGLSSFFGDSLGMDLEGAFGQYEDMRLRSAFQPLVDARSLKPVAYEALLRVNGGAIPPWEAFARPKSAEDIVFFDRLCRSLHAVNFTHQAGESDVLYLNVHGRHLLNVDGGTHGSIFETLLSYCGLKPSQVVLEILESRIDDIDHLVEAVAAYQQRGYRVAIDDFGCRHSNFDRLWLLSPNIVKLDRELIVQSSTNARARLILPKLIEIIHDLGALVVCEGIETEQQHRLAEEAGADLLQGFLFARPAPRLWRPGV
ncbi:MAG TPA: EAL domain-containing protein [Candidatus Sulfotelmatobacter sp.]|nr:EAL domain-containing protein [Candidatus Sulfotelmatobacter sp.]